MVSDPLIKRHISFVAQISYHIGIGTLLLQKKIE